MVLGNRMGLPHNLVGIGALLFALGTVTGVLLNAAFGMIAGTVFGFLVVITALGLLYDTTRAPNIADDEAEEDEEEEDRPNLSFLAWVLHSLITIISITGLIWGIMLFVTIFFLCSYWSTALAIWRLIIRLKNESSSVEPEKPPL